MFPRYFHNDTNAGKSTLFNQLTNAEVYAADQLFATLDPTLRRLTLPDVGTTILADTVGFLRDLPHDLISAFKSTLQETTEASLLLHVIDCADGRKDENIEAVQQVLAEIGAAEVPCLLVFNKIDLLEDVAPHIEYDDKNQPQAVYLSAQSAQGIDLLQQAIRQRLTQQILHIEFALPPNAGKIRHALYQLNCIEQEQISEQGDFLLSINLEKIEWLKLLKHFPELQKFSPPDLQIAE